MRAGIFFLMYPVLFALMLILGACVVESTVEKQEISNSRNAHNSIGMDDDSFRTSIIQGSTGNCIEIFWYLTYEQDFKIKGNVACPDNLSISPEIIIPEESE